MKKSIEEALARAKTVSKSLGIPVRVMDKPRQKAVVCINDFVYRMRILEGWKTIAVFKNGMEV